MLYYYYCHYCCSRMVVFELGLDEGVVRKLK